MKIVNAVRECRHFFFILVEYLVQRQCAGMEIKLNRILYFLKAVYYYILHICGVVSVFWRCLWLVSPGFHLFRGQFGTIVCDCVCVCVWIEIVDEFQCLIISNESESDYDRAPLCERMFVCICDQLANTHTHKDIIALIPLMRDGNRRICGNHNTYYTAYSMYGN